MARSKGKRLMVPCISRIDPIVLYRATSLHVTLLDRYATEAHVPISRFCYMSSCANTFECLLSSSVTGGALRTATTILTVESVMFFLPMTAFGETFLTQLQYLEPKISTLFWGQSRRLVCGISFQSASYSSKGTLTDLLEESNILISD